MNANDEHRQPTFPRSFRVAILVAVAAALTAAVQTWRLERSEEAIVVKNEVLREAARSLRDAAGTIGSMRAAGRQTYFGEPATLQRVNSLRASSTSSSSASS